MPPPKIVICLHLGGFGEGSRSDPGQASRGGLLSMVACSLDCGARAIEGGDDRESPAL